MIVANPSRTQRQQGRGRLRPHLLKKRLTRAARDAELLDRLQNRIGQDLVIAN